MALIQKGQAAEGVASLERGIAAWEAGGGRLDSPYAKSVVAEAQIEAARRKILWSTAATTAGGTFTDSPG
jgi:hypothetical protein